MRIAHCHQADLANRTGQGTSPQLPHGLIAWPQMNSRLSARVLDQLLDSVIVNLNRDWPSGIRWAGRRHFTQHLTDARGKLAQARIAGFGPGWGRFTRKGESNRGKKNDFDFHQPLQGKIGEKVAALPPEPVSRRFRWIRPL
jgi:hypothetical protein